MSSKMNIPVPMAACNSVFVMVTEKEILDIKMMKIIQILYLTFNPCLFHLK